MTEKTSSKERRSDRSGIVLLVEDDGDTRESIRDVLVDAGHRVVCVTNGQEAIDYLYARERPAVIFLDLMMPVMNGWEFLQEQRKNGLFEKIPVVVMSASRIQPENGNDEWHYLPKPLDLSHVLQMANRFVALAHTDSGSELR